MQNIQIFYGGPVIFIVSYLYLDFSDGFIDCSEGKSLTIRNIGSIDYLLSFYIAWMISVRNDNISDRLYTGVFKIYAKGFWFSTTAFFNNIYIAIKQFCQLINSFVVDNFVFVNSCSVVL